MVMMVMMMTGWRDRGDDNDELKDCVDDNDDADKNDGTNLSLWSNGGREGGGDLQHVLHHVLVHLEDHHGGGDCGCGDEDGDLIEEEEHLCGGVVGDLVAHDCEKNSQEE